MDFSEFLNLVENKQFERAKVFVLSTLDDGDFDNLNLIQHLNQTFLKYFSRQEKIKLITHLYNKEQFEEIFHLLHEFSKSELSADCKILYFKSLKKLGQIKLYNKEFDTYFESLISTKSYSGLNLLFSEYEKKFSDSPKHILGQILYFVETNDTTRLKNKLELLRNKFLNEEISIEIIEKAYYFSEQLEFFNSNIFLESKRMKILLLLNKKIEMLSKELVEFLLVAETNLDFILLAETLYESSSFDLIKSFLVEKRKVSLRDFPAILKESKIKESLISKINSSEKQIVEDVDERENIDLSSKFKSENTDDLVSNYKLEDEEQRLLRYIQIVDDKKYYTESFVITFLELNYLTLAKFICQNVERSSNSFYLLGIISLKLKDFSLAIDYANRSLIEFRIIGDEVIPFEIIKAVAFKKLGDTKEFNRIKNEILLLNPSLEINESMWRL